MVWAIMAFLGVPIWMIVGGILTLLWRNRSVRKRPGNIQCRMSAEPGKRWRRGNGIWVHDVFVFTASPWAWNEEPMWVKQSEVRSPTAEEGDKLKRLGDKPVVAEFLTEGGGKVTFAVKAGEKEALRVVSG